MNTLKKTRSIFLLFAMALLAGCLDSGDDSSSNPTGTTTGTSTDATSENYPYLLSKPTVSYTANSVYGGYDVTVTLEATGPDPIYSVDLWIKPTDSTADSHYLELQHVSGTTWSGTTNTYLTIAAGSYYLDSIMIQDGDPFDGGLVKSGWYLKNNIFSSTKYYIDQRLTDNDPANLGIIEFNSGVSGISHVNFTLP